MALFLQVLRRWRWVVPLLLLPWWAEAISPTSNTQPHHHALHLPVVTDSDTDGVADEQDLCPNTPTGTPVNTYGCPQTTSVCSYTTDAFTLQSVGGSGGGTVRYILADSVGTILQVSATPTFSGLSGSHTYMALALRYDGSAVNLTAGKSLSSVSAFCYDWSEALVAKVCVAETDSDGDGIVDSLDLCPNTPIRTPVNAYGCPKTSALCSYTTTSFSLNSFGGSGGGSVRYILADSVGTILQVSATPTFSSLSGSQTYMVLAFMHDGSATGLTAGQSLSAVSASCYDWSDALVIRVCINNDADGDGVIDTLDLCPGTPAGTPVNAYGCPKTQATCDYNTTTITLATTNGVGSGTVSYVLADSVGTILQISGFPSFSGLSGSHTYMALAISYDGAISGLAVGQSLSAVTASCFDWSDALVLKICVPALNSCDYTVGDTIALTATYGGAITTGPLTRYLLVNAGGIIVRLSTNPVFATTGLAAGNYFAYSVIYTDGQSVTNLETGQRLTTVRANCIDFSEPLALRFCSNCVVRCVPIVVRVIRRQRP